MPRAKHILLNVANTALRNQLMNLNRYLESDGDTLSGVPRIKGTRLSVQFIRALFESGWSTNDIVGNYPQLNRASVRAALAVPDRSGSETRANWAPNSKALAAAGEDALVWPEFGNEDDDQLVW
jgi:uncharacterized protein (DUF433 family)